MIQTGDAHAVANVVNIVNTNVIGRNWVFALINVFGNWQGNIAFGQPDLWVGETVSNIPQAVTPGHEMTYTLTVINNGNTDATNVSLRDDFDERYLQTKTLNGGNESGGSVAWNLGTLKPGEAKVISYDVEVKESLPVGGTNVLNTATVSATEPDGQNTDNTETTSVVLVRNREINYSTNPLADFKIKKTHNATTTLVQAGDSVDYEIVLKNDGGGKGFVSRIIDNLFYADETEPIETREWPLDTVYDGEEITVTYTLEVSPDAEPGVYRNVARFIAQDERQVDAYFVSSESFIEVTAIEEATSTTATSTTQTGGLGEGESVEPAEDVVAPEENIISVFNKKVEDVIDTESEIAFAEAEAQAEPVNVFIPPAERDFGSMAALAFLDLKLYWPWLLAAILALLFLLYLVRRRRSEE